jgi:hypothetical protein
MNESTLDISLADVKAAGYRISDPALYKLLLADKLAHISDDLWTDAVNEMILTRTQAYAPKVAEWLGYVRAVYDRKPRIGNEPGTKVAAPAEEYRMPTPTDRHVRAWRKMFGGDINFDQEPDLVLQDIMRAWREKKLRVAHVGTFATFLQTLEPTVPAIGGIVRDVPKKVNPTRKKNELVRALVKAPPPPQPPELTEEDLSAIPF